MKQEIRLTAAVMDMANDGAEGERAGGHEDGRSCLSEA